MSILSEEWSTQTRLPLSFRSTRIPEFGSTTADGSWQRQVNEQDAPSIFSSDVNSVSGSSVTGESVVTPRIGVGAVILNERHEVLLVWRNRQPEQHTWSIPGGKVDAYESLETAVIREIKEEVDLDISIDRLLCTAETIQPQQEEHWISVLYSTKVIGGHARNLEEGGAIGEIGWFRLHDLPSPLACFAVPGLDAVKKLYNQN
ncbi:hypothetical protein C0Q44_15110 [Paenibacillus sp. PCH8]|nr:hypothetical protein C0Q44_15110 [Paenibacillus sp. PCH8]